MFDPGIRNSFGTIKTYREFKEFDREERDKLAEVVEKKAVETFLSPVVEDYIYFTSRALDYGDFEQWLDNSHNKFGKYERSINKNADLFTAKELNETIDDENMKRFETFKTALLYENHKSQDPSLSIGVIFDVYDINKVADNDEMHLTLLSGLDTKRSPHLARAMKTYPTKMFTSMGCKIGQSYCTVCGKVVAAENDMCSHLRYHRNSRVNGIKVAEVLQKIRFIEDSIVSVPACSTASVLDAIHDLSQVFAGETRLLKVASDNQENADVIMLMSNIYHRIKDASTLSEKKMLNNQFDILIDRLSKLL